MITVKNRYTGTVLLEIESLRCADLSHADLSHANLYGADLSHADLSHANLSHANLSHADLYGADLSHADLSHANLSHANLSRADLSHANLSHANLSHANLSHADLRWCIGNMREIKSAQFDTYMVSWSKNTLAIGCQQHTIKTWWNFDDDTIARMDTRALAWWKKWKPIIQQLIEMSA